jgi:uncharacterized protein YbjT (DUF2867 family)
MRRLTVLAICVFGTIGVSGASAQNGKYPPLTDYLMSRDAEVALAQSAAPANTSSQATIKVLTQSGYAIDRQGDNGFVCMVMRGWSAPTYTPEQFRDLVYDARVRAPICFDPGAAQVVMPYYELRSKLAMDGQSTRSDCPACRARLRARRTAATRRRDLRVHVVREPAPGARHQPLASAHDGVFAVLSERDPGKQRVRTTASGRDGRRRNPLCGRGHPRRGQTRHQGRPEGERLEVILITGATGTRGSAVIREFARNNLPVRALVRSAPKAQELDDLPTVDVVMGDMLRAETLAPALDSVDRALMISSAGPEMLDTQCRFIDAARQAGVPHIVKFSGKESGIGFDPMRFRFTRMHEQIEDYLEASGVAWTHLRPSQFMQVYLREAPTIATKRALFLSLENVTLAPIDVHDIRRLPSDGLRQIVKLRGKIRTLLVLGRSD